MLCLGHLSLWSGVVRDTSPAYVHATNPSIDPITTLRASKRSPSFRRGCGVRACDHVFESTWNERVDLSTWSMEIR